MTLGNFKPNSTLSTYLAPATPRPDAFSCAFRKAHDMFLMGTKELEAEDRDDTIANLDSEGDVQAETTLTTMTTGGDISEAGNAETTNNPYTDGDTISNTMPTGGDTSEKSAIDDESGSEDENETRKIERCFRGIQQIEIERLVKPCI